MINPDRRFGNNLKDPMRGGSDFALPKDYKAPSKLQQLKVKLKRFEAMLYEGAKVQGTVDALRKEIALLQQSTSKSDKNIDLSNLKPVGGSDTEKAVFEKQKQEFENEKKKEKNKKILLYVALAVAGFFAYKKLFKK
jgi:hypothetical protein